MDWDNLASFHKPHEYLDDAPKKHSIDKKFHASAKKAGKHLRSQKIQKGKYPEVEFADFDFKKYYPY